MLSLLNESHQELDQKQRTELQRLIQRDHEFHEKTRRPSRQRGSLFTELPFATPLSVFAGGTIRTAARARPPGENGYQGGLTTMSESREREGQTAGRGRLAQVIATRGGLAAPEAPFVIEHREALIYMLCEAAELEHGIMCQYLYAAFSLKQTADEGLTAEEAEAVQRWRKTISHVATQEMLHLSLVQNLLSAIGCAPHLSRANFPHPASSYPAGVHLALLPFGEPALQHFMFLERPEGMDLDDAQGMAAFGRARPAMQPGEIVPHGQDFATVGHLYRSIEAGIAHLADKFGERWLFVGPPRAQATEQYFVWPELVAVTDVASRRSGPSTRSSSRARARAGTGRTPTSASSSRSWTSTTSSARPTRPSTRSAPWSRSTCARPCARPTPRWSPTR